MKSLHKYFLIIIAAITFSNCVTDEIEPDNSLLPGDRCPDFSVELLDGRTITSAMLRGQKSLIVFFNTECADCRRELAVVQQAYDRFPNHEPDQTPQIVCIARTQTEASVRKYWMENDLTLPVAPQSDNSVYRLFATIGIPRIYAIDPEGTITATWSDDPLPSLSELLERL